MSVMKLLTSSPFNVVINNLFWAGCVVGRYEYLWLVAPAIFSYVALLIVSESIRLRQLLPIISVGIVIDSLYTASGVFQFQHHTLLLPLWMWLLWVAFSTTLPLSLRLLGRNTYLAALTGALGFPFSYYLGFQLGAVSFGLPLGWVMLMLGLTWGVLLPILFKSINNERVFCNEAY